MNLRSLSLAISTIAALAGCATYAQSEVGAVSAPYSDQNAVTAVAGAGYLTSTQTQVLLSQIAQSFIPGFTPASPGTTASLLSAAPASASNVGKYAVVSDLFGGTTNEVLRSGYSAGFGYYWRPQRTDYASSVTASGGTLTLTPLANAPFQYLSGTLASSLTISLSTTNAWPGAQFCVSNNLTLGLATVSLTGIGLPSTNMVGGASKCVVFDGASWRPF